MAIHVAILDEDEMSGDYRFEFEISINEYTVRVTAGEDPCFVIWEIPRQWASSRVRWRGRRPRFAADPWAGYLPFADAA